MSNYLDTARAVYRRIPFISPALTINSLGNYSCKIDERVASEREIAFSILGVAALASYVFIPSFGQLTFKYIFTINSSIAFIGVACFVTTGAVIVGIVSLEILGYKLDQMLTNRAATHLAIKEYHKKVYPSSEFLDWLIADTGRIKQLLTHENIDLSKTDYLGNSLLLMAAKSGNLEMFTLLCENSCDQDKAKVFFECVDNLQDSNWGEESLKIVDYMVDTKQISAVMFTDEEQCSMQKEPLRGHFKWTDEHIKWLQKLGSLGFSIDVGGVKSIRYAMSEDIFSKALSHAAGRPTAVENDIFAAMRFLQKNSNNKASAVLEGNVWNKNMLEAIAPSLVATESALRQVFYDDNVTIGNLLWDKSDPECNRKSVFIRYLFKDKSKLATSLIEEGKVSANMFTKKEQCDVLWAYRNLASDGDDECFLKRLNKLSHFGFDIRAKNFQGKTVRDRLIEAIASPLYNEEEKSYIKSLESVDKILEKQNIATAVVLKQGQISVDDSNLSMFPDDIMNHLFQVMIATH